MDAVMFNPESLKCFLNLGFDEIIDVRSPSEYREDHVFDAVNLPVLSDAERARVGQLYHQESRFGAKRVGAALVSRNIAGHLEQGLSERPGSYRPLVYCWRGGERSGATAHVLRRVGWRVDTLAGGYRTFRRLVADCMHNREFPCRVVLLEGYTGVAKTAMLELLSERGAQTINLERLAGHRGSLFGATSVGQPSQKAFESALARQSLQLDTGRPVVVEAESNRIGELLIPPSLWRAMRNASRLAINAPLEARVSRILEDFAELLENAQGRERAIRKLAPFHSKERISGWLQMSSDGKFQDLVSSLIRHHYDPRYRRHRENSGPPAKFAVELTGTSPEDLEAAVELLMSQGQLDVAESGKTDSQGSPSMTPPITAAVSPALASSSIT